MNLSDINNLDFNNAGNWPAPIKAVAIVLLCAGVVGAGYWFDTKEQLAVLEKAERVEVEKKEIFENKQRKAANLEPLREQLEEVDYIAIVDANRYSQFTAAPRAVPVFAAFYEQLVAGELGYERIRRFKRYPALGPVVFRDDGAEPSFLGYDHPAVLLFALREGMTPEEALEPLERRLQRLEGCPDRSLEEASRGLGKGPFATFRRVTLPMVRPGLAAGAALVFVTTLKELPATLILRPTGFVCLEKVVIANGEVVAVEP